MFRQGGEILFGLLESFGGTLGHFARQLPGFLGALEPHFCGVSDTSLAFGDPAGFGNFQCYEANGGSGIRRGRLVFHELMILRRPLRWARVQLLHLAARGSERCVHAAAAGWAVGLPPEGGVPGAESRYARHAPTGGRSK